MMIRRIKYFFKRVKRKAHSLWRLLLEPASGKRKLFQYSAYLFIIIAMNFFVGKNMANTRYAWYSNVSIFLLININIILILVLMLVIFRSLAKLLSEAHSNIFGARLKVKLVIFSIITTVVPIAVFLFFAMTVVNNSINKWFDSRIDSALASSVILMEDYQKMVKQDLFDQSLLLSKIISDSDIYDSDNNRSVLEGFIQEYVGKNIVMGAAVFDNVGRKMVEKDNLNKHYLNNLSKKYLSGVLRGNKETGYEFIDEDQIYWSALPVLDDIDGKEVIKGALFTYKITPKKSADDIDLIQESRDRYREGSFFSFPIKKAYFMMLILMAMLVIFAGIWGGILFAGGITKPIEALSDAAVEISKGNLDVSVKEQGTDEISYLIKTFNKMVRQISLHTKEMHNKNTMLSEMYSQISRDNMYIDAMFKNVDSAVILIAQDLTPLKSNAKADSFIFNHKDEFKNKVLNIINTFQTSGDKDFFDNIEILGSDETRIYSLSLSKIASDEEEQTLLVLDDITDIINAQRISVWKEVATRIAHEIKNPLTPIKLMAERIKKRAAEVHENKVKDLIIESMDAIVVETDNLLELVEEFNMFARLPKAKKYPFDLSEILSEIGSLYSPTAYPNIDFSYKSIGNTIINCDRLQLRRVFQNIIGNAIFAVGQSGKIDIFINGNDENSVTIYIEDNGIGIKPEDVFKIFEPYFSKRSGGTGLGLAIVKKIIEEHDGKLSVESVQNKGTKFIIVIPRGFNDGNFNN